MARFESFESIGGGLFIELTIETVELSDPRQILELSMDIINLVAEFISCVQFESIRNQSIITNK